MASLREDEKGQPTPLRAKTDGEQLCSINSSNVQFAMGNRDFPVGDKFLSWVDQKLSKFIAEGLAGTRETILSCQAILLYEMAQKCLVVICGR